MNACKIAGHAATYHWLYLLFCSILLKPISAAPFTSVSTHFQNDTYLITQEHFTNLYKMTNVFFWLHGSTSVGLPKSIDLTFHVS